MAGTQGRIVEHRLQGHVRAAADGGGETEGGQHDPGAGQVGAEDARPQLGGHRLGQEPAQDGEVAAQDDHLRVEEVDQDGGAGAQRRCRPCCSAARVRASPASARAGDLGQPRLEVAGGVVHRVVGVGGLAQQRAQADDGLPAAAPAAAADAPSGSPSGGVPDLAGQSPGPAEQLAGHDHAAADADLAGQVDEVGRARLRAHHPLRDRGQVRVVLDPDGAAEVDPGPQPVQDGDVVPADVGRVGRDPVDAADQARDGDGDPDRDGPVGGGGVGGLADQLGHRVQRRARRPSAGTSRAIRCSNSTSPRRSRTRVAA